jgi:hypothetical protein
VGGPEPRSGEGAGRASSAHSGKQEAEVTPRASNSSIEASVASVPGKLRDPRKFPATLT